MSEAQQRRRRQLKISRLEIVSSLYKRGYSIRKIQSEVMKRLELTTYSTATVKRDIDTLLAEWRASRLEDMDMALQLELERIDETVTELWEQWEKSKTDYSKTSRKQKGSPVKDGTTGASTIRTYQTEKTETEIFRLGDPSYIAEIRQQLAERRKLLGLYASTRTEITGKDGKDLIPTAEMTREEIMAEIERIRAIRNAK